MDRARTRCLDPIDSIGQLLSITVGRNTLAEGILYQITEQGVELYEEESTELDRPSRYLRSGQCTGPFRVAEL